VRHVLVLVLVLGACGKRADRADRVTSSARDSVPITITSIYPGASPAVTASSVTTPLERQLAQASHLEALHSRSTDGRSIIGADFAAGTDVDVASQEVQKALNAAMQQLPQGLPTPPTYTRASRKGAVLRLTVTSQVLPLEAVAGSARDLLAQKLSQVAGVGDVEVCGPEDETRITVDLATLAASGKTLTDLRAAIANAAISPAALDRSSQSAAQIEARLDLPILREVARVATDVSVSSCVALGDGKRVIGVTVMPQVGADPLEVRERLEAILPKLREELQAMNVRVWPRTRPLAYEILLNPEMATERRVDKLAHVIDRLQLSTVSLLQLGLPGHDPDVADLRIVPSTQHPEELASLASVFEENQLVVLDPHDHVVGFSGPDPTALRVQSDALVALVGHAKGLRVVARPGSEEHVESVVNIDRDRAAALGIAPDEIATALRVLANGGMWVSTTSSERGLSRVVLAVDGRLPDVLGQVMVRSTNGSLVPLSAVATVTQTREPTVVFHEDQFPWVGVRIAGPLDALNDVLAKLPVPADIKREVRDPD
jgi:multidrug efflux pump subunit AcrB